MSAVRLSLFIYFCVAATVFSLTLDTLIVFGDTTVFVEVADTSEERALGLGGRDSLPDSRGMLFVFATDGLYSFWMKDVPFSIDILWIDSRKRVVYVAERVSPESYPDAFVSPVFARYVLEVPSGFSREHGVGVGSVLAWR